MSKYIPRPESYSNMMGSADPYDPLSIGVFPTTESVRPVKKESSTKETSSGSLLERAEEYNRSMYEESEFFQRQRVIKRGVKSNSECIESNKQCMWRFTF